MQIPTCDFRLERSSPCHDGKLPSQLCVAKVVGDRFLNLSTSSIVRLGVSCDWTLKIFDVQSIDRPLIGNDVVVTESGVEPIGSIGLSEYMRKMYVATKADRSGERTGRNLHPSRAVPSNPTHLLRILRMIGL